jgi:hypothetical protein
MGDDGTAVDDVQLKMLIELRKSKDVNLVN